MLQCASYCTPDVELHFFCHASSLPLNHSGFGGASRVQTWHCLLLVLTGCSRHFLPSTRTFFSSEPLGLPALPADPDVAAPPVLGVDAPVVAVVLCLLSLCKLAEGLVPAVPIHLAFLPSRSLVCMRTACDMSCFAKCIMNVIVTPCRLFGFKYASAPSALLFTQ
jgi:hypothetical protein